MSFAVPGEDAERGVERVSFCQFMRGVEYFEVSVLFVVVFSLDVSVYNCRYDSYAIT